MAGSIPISDSQNSLAPPEAQLEVELCSSDESSIGKALGEEHKNKSAQNDPWIFRDGRITISGPDLVRDLARRIDQARTPSSLLDSLIESGELEAALADAGSPASAVVARLTDLLAAAICSNTAVNTDACRLLEQLHVPAEITVSPPEGFTYYALHPLDFANIVARIPDEPAACALIGIRSIGTTLSAMSAAALKRDGRPVSRISVRPTGHPYARRTEFTDDQIAWIRQQSALPAQFLIVDEGPGRSGSTLLSVAEELVRTGVAAERITILGSRQPEPNSLCAENAASRWQAFRFLSTIPSVNSRFESCKYVGGGEWRSVFFPNPQIWPESWTQMERLKFVSQDGSTLFKFEGMGRNGHEVRERASALAKAGWSPRVSDSGDGFLAYDLVQGKRLGKDDLHSQLLEQIAHYCAFRDANFTMKQDPSNALREMLIFNVRQEFDVELPLPEDAFLTENPVLADGRMQPHEWIAKSSGFLKVDSISHGDDHFFPGPCDIAWDLAGTAVEWQLDQSGIDFLVSRFQNLAGRDVKDRLRIYTLAYAVFRMGYCKMAISTVRGTLEEGRLLNAYQNYRAAARHVLSRFFRDQQILEAA